MITPYHGRTPAQGGFGPEPDVDVWRRDWAERNGCAGPMPDPSWVSHPHVDVTEEVWECGAAQVIALSVEGLGHAWPSTEGLDRAGRPNQTATFDFTREHLLDFFSANRLLP